MFTDCGQKITDFSEAFVSLKQSLDSSNTVQAVFVSTWTFEGVEKLGACFDCASLADADEVFVI
jgi:hypothetical protein